MSGHLNEDLESWVAKRVNHRSGYLPTAGVSYQRGHDLEWLPMNTVFARRLRQVLKHNVDTKVDLKKLICIQDHA